VLLQNRARRSPNASVNENKFFNGYPDELSENLKYLDALGGPDTYNHYPTGWAIAFSTPFRCSSRIRSTPAGRATRWLSTVAQVPLLEQRATMTALAYTRCLNTYDVVGTSHGVLLANVLPG
jgi:hypothetical protein